ncbi:hypothetical protein F7725_023182 [Dissostichus mawsoni]|uniref:Ig-like domain-containing protein n=1 Tax=Dissostichus mawsoni TaxID=36200 RepID=A0A7J5Z2W2_DISMA|nr:hypothetical protein F7725_023182 [Dissostichus mawsoni]
MFHTNIPASSNGIQSIARYSHTPIIANICTFPFLSRELNGEQIKMTASLVFKKVSDEDLLKDYTCKLQTVTGPLTFVTISLSQKHSPSYVPRALGIVGFVLMTLAVVVYVRFTMIKQAYCETTECLLYSAAGDHDGESVCSRSPTEIYVKAGEMMALNCNLNGEENHRDAELIWTSPTSQEMDQTPNMSSAEQRHRDLLVHGRSLVILNATANHQGNYSCSLGNTSSQLWFRLRVCTKQSRGCEQRSHYPKICYTREACTLYCPDVYTPAAITLNITSNGVIWYKEGESTPKASYFSSVEKKDDGVYTCTRSYLYYGKIYNMTFTLVLDIQPKGKKNTYPPYVYFCVLNKSLCKMFPPFLHPEKPVNYPVITSPRSGVIHVNLGSPKVIDCKALMYSDFDQVFWFISNSTGINGEQKKITASLVFKKVSDEDLLKNYTCKLQTVTGSSTNVTISLSQNHCQHCVGNGFDSGILKLWRHIFVISLSISSDKTLLFVCIDEKSYDAFLMCYKSDTDAGLNEDDRMCLESVLEERLAVAEAVLDCIEESRTVLLVPSSPDTGPGSGLLSAIHAALVEWQTRLVFIKTEKTEVLRSGSFPEALQILSEAGACVTWKGMRSMPLSSPFWKQLPRYSTAALQSCGGGDLHDAMHTVFEPAQAEGVVQDWRSGSRFFLYLHMVGRSSVGCSTAEESSVVLELDIGGKVPCPGLNCSNNTELHKPVSYCQNRDSCVDETGRLHLCEVYREDTGVFFCDRKIIDSRRAVNVTAARKCVCVVCVCCVCVCVCVFAFTHSKIDDNTEMCDFISQTAEPPSDPPRVVKPYGNVTQEVELATETNVSRAAIIEKVTLQHLNHTYTRIAKNSVGNCTGTIKLKKKIKDTHDF